MFMGLLFYWVMGLLDVWKIGKLVSWNVVLLVYSFIVFAVSWGECGVVFWVFVWGCGGQMGEEVWCFLWFLCTFGGVL